jgi:hypothetical protein
MNHETKNTKNTKEQSKNFTIKIWDENNNLQAEHKTNCILAFVGIAGTDETASIIMTNCNSKTLLGGLLAMNKAKDKIYNENPEFAVIKKLQNLNEVLKELK